MTTPNFKTEVELCSAYIEWMKSKHPEWTAYAETAGWDILMVHEDGTQVGIQAPLKFNMTVLEQAVGGYYCKDSNPDFRTILVLKGSRKVCFAVEVQSMDAKRNALANKLCFCPERRYYRSRPRTQRSLVIEARKRSSETKRYNLVGLLDYGTFMENEVRLNLAFDPVVGSDYYHDTDNSRV